VSASVCLARLSPLPSQGRGQGEGSDSQLEPRQKLLTSILSPLRKGRGEPTP
jgi:hypothetical protein